ncbi:ubiquitin-like modifier-activating enzyme 1 isoform X1, partial [Tachysurus ichikawai]
MYGQLHLHCWQLFCDFGENFLVKDKDGDPPNVSMIAHVSKENPGIVTCTDDQAAFLDGKHVVFSGVQGMTELNSYGPIEVKMLDNYSFSICDTSNFTEFEKGGVATEVKETKMLNFIPLDVALEKVMQDEELLVPTDHGKVQRHQSLHLGFRALQEFQQKYNRLPKSRNQ